MNPYKIQYQKVINLVEDAKKQSCQIVCGGEATAGKGYFYPITLITGAKAGMRIVDEEQFGPVVPIIKYPSLDDAIQQANSLEVGLGASVWSSDLEQAQAVAHRLEAGTVWINQHGAIHPLVPFGGSKYSGFGVEFGIEELKAVAQPRVISLKK